MDFTLFLNFILNQILAKDPPPIKHPASPLGQSTLDHNDPSSPPLLVDHTKPTQSWPSWHGDFDIFKEVSELMRRFFDKSYANSRIYQLRGSTRSAGRVAVISDGENPIGSEVTVFLAKNGYKVYVGMKEGHVNRSSEDNSGDDKNKPKIMKLDLRSLESVKEFAKELAKVEPKIDLLINSANVFENQLILTRDGFEMMFQENYLSHFLLTNLLLPNLKESDNGRVVNMSSIGQYFGVINFDDINNLVSKIPFKAYSQSKLANVLFTRELAKRLKDTNVSSFAVSSEFIKKPEFVSEIPLFDCFSQITDPTLGAQTVLYVSMDESLRNESGFYYNNLKKLHPLPSNARDDITAKKLWDLSEKWVKLTEVMAPLAGQSSH